jgi:hypothetical protein
MATGKTVAKYITVTIDDSGGTPRIITPSCNSVSQLGLEMESPDVTSYSDGWVNVLVALGSSEIELGGPFNNTATTGAHAVFPAVAGTNVALTFSVAIGILAQPTTGDPKWSGEYVCDSYTVIPGGPNDAVMWKATIKPYGSTAGAWGTV